MLSLPKNLGTFSLTANPTSSDNWVNKAAAFGNYGIPPSEYNVSHLSDEPVTHSYALYPWADDTHLYIQEGMLVFAAKHIDTNYNLCTIAPVFKLNYEQAKSHSDFKIARTRNGSEAQKFQRYLNTFGESVLESYHLDLKRGITVENPGDLPEFYRMAQKNEFRYLTRFGILNLWNFLGTVVSKGESTGASTYLDSHQNTDILYIAGVSVAKRAETNNVWGNIDSGSRVYLILTRKDKDSPLQWISYADDSREYPERLFRKYEDASGRWCKSYILPIGTVSKSIKKIPSVFQINQALGLNGASVKEGYEANGTLGFAIVQIGI